MYPELKNDARFTWTEVIFRMGIDFLPWRPRPAIIATTLDCSSSTTVSPTISADCLPSAVLIRHFLLSLTFTSLTCGVTAGCATPGSIKARAVSTPTRTRRHESELAAAGHGGGLELGDGRRRIGHTVTAADHLTVDALASRSNVCHS